MASFTIKKDSNTLDVVSYKTAVITWLEEHFGPYTSHYDENLSEFYEADNWSMEYIIYLGKMHNWSVEYVIHIPDESDAIQFALVKDAI